MLSGCGRVVARRSTQGSQPRAVRVGLLVSGVLCRARLVQPTLAQAPTALPRTPVYEVDPTWPKPLPNLWGIGPVSGISANSRDHVWIVHRTETVRQAGGKFIARDTKGAGSVWDIEFSLDYRQRFMFVADGTNEKVWILDRESMSTLGSFGSSGHEAGQFATPVHDLTMNSKGRIYTGEAATAGRVQKFTLEE